MATRNRQLEKLQLPTMSAALTAVASKNALKLMDDVYDVTVRQFKVESDRAASLDGKAGTLLAAVGVSVTLTTSIGATLLFEGTKSMSGDLRGLLAAAFIIAVLLGLASAALAVWAARISSYREPSSEVLTGSAVTLAAEGDEDDLRKAIYRREVVQHLWICWDANFSVNERKAAKIQAAQYLFLAFISVLAVLASLVVILSRAHTS